MSSSILTQHVAPALGTLVALLLFLAPLKTLKAAMQGTRLLGDINPVPFPLLATNCAGWVAYGYLLRDYYVVVANINGLVLAMHYTLQAYCLCSMGGERTEGKRKLLHGTVVGASLMMAYVGLVVALPLGDKEEARKLVLGLVCNAVLVCFYASPLAEVKTVIASKSSDALVFPMCLMNVINGTLWAVYGFALSDYLIAAPNALGALFGVLQCTLCAIYPRRRGESNAIPVSPSTEKLDALVSADPTNVA